METTKLVYRSTLIREYGWSMSKIEEYLTPAKIVKNPHYSKMSSYLYDLLEAEKIKSAISVSPKIQTVKNWRIIIEQKYKDKFAELYRDTIEYMFNLNRYAKYSSCSKRNKEEIYGIKDELLAKLYLAKKIDHVERHYQTIAPLVCYRCDGNGFINEDVYAKCPKCNGTGIFREKQILYFACFFIEVEENVYSFHQPEDLLTYKIVYQDTVLREFDIQGEKPLSVGMQKNKEMKETIKYFIQIS
jgi:hypothetical protein